MEQARRAIRIELSARTLLIALGVALAAWVAWRLTFVVVILACALVLAGTLNPFVAGLEKRRVPRSIALVTVFTLLVAAIVVVGLVTVPSLVSQLVDIMERAPEMQKNVAAALERSDFLRPLARSVRNAHPAAYMAMVGEHVLAYGSRLAILIGEVVTTLFLALYIIAGREREQAALYAVVPRRFHLRLARIMLNLETIVGGYVRGQVLTSVLMTVFVFLLLTIVGVPNALAIAVFAGVTDVLPFIGALLVTAPAVLAAWAARGVPGALIVLVALIIYQELESRVLVPRIYGRVLRLSPVAVIIALLAGATLLGIVGALLALPVAAAIRMMIVELRVGMPGDDVDRSREAARDEAAERIFHRRAAGAPPGQAAEIATQIAEKIREQEPEKI